MNLGDLEKIVKQTLSEKRFYHSICVMEECEILAKKYNSDVEIAKKVGIVHDIAKEMSPNEKLEYMNNNNLPIDEIEKINTGLLHAKIGADIAKKHFGFSTEMCNAIKFHSTGRENMSLLEKILFMSDWCSKDRTFEESKIAKNMLQTESLDNVLLYTFNSLITELLEKNSAINLNTIKARNYLLGVKN